MTVTSNNIPFKEHLDRLLKKLKNSANVKDPDPDDPTLFLRDRTIDAFSQVLDMFTRRLSDIECYHSKVSTIDINDLFHQDVVTFIFDSSKHPWTEETHHLPGLSFSLTIATDGNPHFELMLNRELYGYRRLWYFLDGAGYEIKDGNDNHINISLLIDDEYSDCGAYLKGITKILVEHLVMPLRDHPLFEDKLSRLEMSN